MRPTICAQTLDTAIPSSPVTNSVNSIVRRSGGLLVSKALVLSANNTTASMNAFQLTGSVAVKKLWAEITAKTTLGNLTGGSFDLYDSTAAIQLTANDGVLSGCAVGTIVAKHGLAAVTWGKLDNAAGSSLEGAAAGPVWCETILTQKTGANTYLRLTYTTSDEPIACTVTVYCSYVPLGAGSLVAV